MNSFNGNFVLRWRRVIIGASALLILVGFIAASRIEGGADFISSFDEDTQVRRDFEAVSKAFNGANFITVLIDARAPDALTNPTLIDAIDSYQDWLRAQPEVGAAVSFVDQLKLTNLALHNNEPLHFGVPGEASAVKQILLFASGEALNRMDSVELRIADNKLAAQSERSNAEDLDMVQALSEFQLKQNGYDAALKSYSAVQKLSLFQYVNP